MMLFSVDILLPPKYAATKFVTEMLIVRMVKMNQNVETTVEFFLFLQSRVNIIYL